MKHRDAVSFYADVIGYERATVEVEGAPYEVLRTGDQPRAGVVRIPYDDVEPAWAPYLAVADLGATLAGVRELGGRVIIEPSPEFAGGAVALITDPGGAALFLYGIDAAKEVAP